MPSRSLNDIFLALRPMQSATLTAVYSGRDMISRKLDRFATLADLADMLPARSRRSSGTLTYVRVVIDNGPRRRGGL
jgi:hypothetical protein